MISFSFPHEQARSGAIDAAEASSCDAERWLIPSSEFFSHNVRAAARQYNTPLCLFLLQGSAGARRVTSIGSHQKSGWSDRLYPTPDRFPCFPCFVSFLSHVLHVIFSCGFFPFSVSNCLYFRPNALPLLFFYDTADATNAHFCIFVEHFM